MVRFKSRYLVLDIPNLASFLMGKLDNKALGCLSAESSRSKPIVGSLIYDHKNDVEMQKGNALVLVAIKQLLVQAMGDFGQGSLTGTGLQVKYHDTKADLAVLRVARMYAAGVKGVLGLILPPNSIMNTLKVSVIAEHGSSRSCSQNLVRLMRQRLRERGVLEQSEVKKIREMREALLGFD